MSGTPKTMHEAIQSCLSELDPSLAGKIEVVVLDFMAQKFTAGLLGDLSIMALWKLISPYSFEGCGSDRDAKIKDHACELEIVNCDICSTCKKHASFCQYCGSSCCGATEASLE